MRHGVLLVLWVASLPRSALQPVAEPAAWEAGETIKKTSDSDAVTLARAQRHRRRRWVDGPPQPPGPRRRGAGRRVRRRPSTGCSTGDRGSAPAPCAPSRPRCSSSSASSRRCGCRAAPCSSTSCSTRRARFRDAVTRGGRGGRCPSARPATVRARFTTSEGAVAGGIAGTASTPWASVGRVQPRAGAQGTRRPGGRRGRAAGRAARHPDRHAGHGRERFGPGGVRRARQRRRRRDGRLPAQPPARRGRWGGARDPEPPQLPRRAGAARRVP